MNYIDTINVYKKTRNTYVLFVSMQNIHYKINNSEELKNSKINVFYCFRSGIQKLFFLF